MRASCLVIVASLTLSGCFLTQTEIIRAGDSIRLAGSQFVDEGLTPEKTTFRWNEARKGYLAAEQDVLARFARLSGDTYIIQFQALGPGRPAGLPASADSNVFMVTPIRIAGSKLQVDTFDCRAKDPDTRWLARGYGVEFNYEGEQITAGTRAGIIGFLAANAARCPRKLLGADLRPEAIVLTGRELAADGDRYDRARVVAYLAKACDAGDREPCYALGQALQKGDGAVRDVQRAAQLFDKACAARDMRGCLDLGLLYDRGEGVPRDSERGRRLLQQACDGGEPFACAMLKR